MPYQTEKRKALFPHSAIFTAGKAGADQEGKEKMNSMPLITRTEKKMILSVIQSEILQYGRTRELLPEGSDSEIAVSQNLAVLISIRDKIAHLIVQEGINKMAIQKTILDNIIITFDDETGIVSRMEKMINIEEVTEFVKGCENVLTARFGKKMEFPVEPMEENLRRWMKENEQMAAMMRFDFDFKQKQVFYSFGMLDQNMGAEDPNHKENGFFVYEKMGVIYFPPAA